MGKDLHIEYKREINNLKMFVICLDLRIDGLLDESDNENKFQTYLRLVAYKEELRKLIRKLESD